MKNTIATLLITCMALAGCKDPCEGIACFNGGICQEGDCLCPPQWTGSQCKEEVPPTEIRVGKFTATWWNYDQNGMAWDATDAPDVWITLSGPEYDNWPMHYAENTEDGTTWTVDPSFRFTSPTSTYTMKFWDWDDDGNHDFMGEVKFKPYQNGLKFPDQLLFLSSDFRYSITLENVEYLH